MKKRVKKKHPKKPKTTKRTKRPKRPSRNKGPKPNRGNYVTSYMYRRYMGYGIDEAADWEYDSSRIKMLCINCYAQFYIWAHDKFKAQNWFCDQCRIKISKRKWQLIAKFHKHMEAARFRRKNPIDLDHGDVLGFTNSIYRCVRGKASRDHVIKNIKLSLDLASFTDPITLGRLLDLYDRVVGIHAKRRKP